MMKGLVVLACLRFLAAISAHSASNGSDGPVLLVWFNAADPNDNALACRGGARRGLVCPCNGDRTGGGTEPVILPNHCSGFGRADVDETGSTAVVEIWLASLAKLPDGAGEAEVMLVVGDVVFGIGDLLMAGVDALPKEEVDAVLKAGLADGGVPKTPTVLATGVLITLGVAAFVFGRMGLTLEVLVRIGVNLWFEVGTGDGESCQVVPTWFRLLRSSFLSLLLLLLLLLFKLGSFCSFISSMELLLVTAGVLLVEVLMKSCLATELALLWVGNGPKSSMLVRRERPREIC